jgi:hypothetical protein
MIVSTKETKTTSPTSIFRFASSIPHGRRLWVSDPGSTTALPTAGASMSVPTASIFSTHAAQGKRLCDLLGFASPKC